MAGTQFQHSSPRPETHMEESEVPLNTINYDYESNPADLEHDELVNEIRNIPSKSLWQISRRRSSSCHSSDDMISHYDSSSTSSKYNFDFDTNPSTGTHSPATSWSSHCDEACDHATSSSSTQNPGKTEEHTTSLQQATSGKSLKLSIDTQNLPPWDPMFPDWYQCLSPGPIRQLGAAWSALKDSNTQGLAQAKDLEERLSRLQLDEEARIDQLIEEVKALSCDVNRIGSRDETMDKHGTQKEQEKEPDILQRTTPVGMVDEIVTRLGSMIAAQHRLSKQNTILTSLNFKARAARHEAIPKTYARTYDWVFQSSLSKWLQEDSDMFWVSG
ncbi:hypothetical protein VMCG_09703 [Cytospora schulzeri]|uniref:Uncharacterized protein n=1 Tax=Cytospora schulzeri TaxID=448051 RepID=A0A423VK43_9PEZI|nr:hypothetical protein VMCG_09703 [Valsa malicola]